MRVRICVQTSYQRLQWELWSGIGSLESPQHKGRVPQYLQDKLSDLQQKFDQLEQLGVFKKLGDISVVAEEYLNPSLLIKKPTGGTV